jgi:hypothetical protein
MQIRRCDGKRSVGAACGRRRIAGISCSSCVSSWQSSTAAVTGPTYHGNRQRRDDDGPCEHDNPVMVYWSFAVGPVGLSGISVGDQETLPLRGPQLVGSGPSSQVNTSLSTSSTLPST